jgi:hypothetical protein
MDEIKNTRKWSAVGRCSSGACPEIEFGPDGVTFTDSATPGSVTYSPASFRFLVDAAKRGELDDLI